MVSKTNKQDANRSSARSDPRHRVQLGFLTGLVGFNLRLAQLRVFEDFKQTMRATDNATIASITPGLFRILLLVDENAGMNQSNLARAVEIDRSTLVPILNKLESLGLLERRASDTDRRSHALHLTPLGRDTISQMQQRVIEHEAKVVEKLSATEKKTLIDLLSRLS